MRFNLKTLKICLVILCLLPIRAVGTPQFSGANFFMKEIELTQGKIALVDDEDFEYLNQWKWHIQKSGGTFYAIRTEWLSKDKCVCVRMHRSILGINTPLIVDHKDGNGLNNTRNNLRICTISQNQRNRKSSKKGSSKYLGVHFCNTRKKWVTQIQHDNKSKCIGVFTDEKEAANAYNLAALKFHGEFAKLNEL